MKTPFLFVSLLSFLFLGCNGNAPQNSIVLEGTITNPVATTVSFSI